VPTEVNQKCGLCLKPVRRDDEVKLTTGGRICFWTRICEDCFDGIDSVRRRGLELVKASESVGEDGRSHNAD
jgi:hypothetical protein